MILAIREDRKYGVMFGMTELHNVRRVTCTVRSNSVAYNGSGTVTRNFATTTATAVDTVIG
jgi:hypothetical protein